jgi:hypothetical protein
MKKIEESYMQVTIEFAVTYFFIQVYLCERER